LKKASWEEGDRSTRGEGHIFTVLLNWEKASEGERGEKSQKRGKIRSRVWAGKTMGAVDWNGEQQT